MTASPLPETTQGRLLLYCLRAALGLESAELLFGRLCPADWAGVARLASMHHLAPLLHFLFQTSGSTKPPAFVMDGWQQIRQDQAENLERKWTQLAQVLAALREQGLDVMVLKGAALAATIYDDRALRSFGDCDLLVPREALVEAEAVLGRLGYEPLERWAAQKDYFLENVYHAIPYGEKTANTVIELHWNLLMPAWLDLKAGVFWERARPASIAGVDVRVLSPEDWVFHLAIHTSLLHQYTVKLRDFYDLRLVLERLSAEMNWEHLIALTRRHGLGKCVGLPLLLAQQMLGAWVEDQMITALGCDLSDRCLSDLLQDYVLRSPLGDVLSTLRVRREEDARAGDYTAMLATIRDSNQSRAFPLPR
jgi:hypothetical protein